jgi:hypothetical protein
MPRRPKVCKPCDLASVVKDHIKLLMQVFDSDLKEYGMQLITTQCLNTAVTLMYAFLGNKALAHTRYCDVKNVQSRYSLNPAELSKREVISFANSILNPRLQLRTLYYVMITDVKMHHPTNNTFVEFPGHVFIIDINPSCRGESNTPECYIYQSYIMAYQFKGAERVRYPTLKTIVNGLQHMFNTPVWDTICSQTWETITGIKADEFEGYSRENIHFCYRTTKIKHCTEILEKMLQEKLKKLQEGARTTSATDIYGGVRSYFVQDTPLTNQEVKTELQLILDKLNNGKPSNINYNSRHTNKK